MPHPELWNTTVHDLMLNFRDCLVALIPYMDRAKIPWRDHEAYDQWDEITETLYKHMVVGTVLFAIGDQDELITPRYDMLYPSYGEKSFIAIESTPSPSSTQLVFLSFSTRERPFDHVNYQAVSGPDLLVVGEPARMPFEDARFVFMAKKADGTRQKLTTILVEL